MICRWCPLAVGSTEATLFANGDADLCRQRVVEEFFVSAPPERVIHHCRARERGVFEPRPIERDILRDAINHNVVTAWLALDHFFDTGKFRDDLFAAGFLINPLNKCRRETVFLAKKNSDFFHSWVVSFRAKPKAKSRNLWNLQTSIRDVSTSSAMTQRQSSWWTLLTPGLSSVPRSTRNQPALTALSIARV